MTLGTEKPGDVVVRLLVLKRPVVPSKTSGVVAVGAALFQLAAAFQKELPPLTAPPFHMSGVCASAAVAVSTPMPTIPASISRVKGQSPTTVLARTITEMGLNRERRVFIRHKSGVFGVILECLPGFCYCEFSQVKRTRILLYPEIFGCGQLLFHLPNWLKIFAAACPRDLT